MVYNARGFMQFNRWHEGTKHEVEGRLGDRPAVMPRTLQDGLHVFSYESTLLSLTYKDWASFRSFAEHKDFPDIEKQHQNRDLPETDFKEIYVRFCKALIAVGEGHGKDLNTGLETEFIALANPYTDTVDQGLPLLLMYKGAPRPDAQVELFERAPDGSVEITLHRTDDKGRVSVPVKPGHSYLVDAVVLRVPSKTLADEEDAVWETLWASLTFAVPQ